MRELFWKELYDLKFQVYYYDLHYERLYKIEKYVTTSTQVVSSLSLTIWAITNDYSFVWSSIIACSQLVNMILITLSVADKIKTLSEVIMSLSSMFTEFDYYWLDINEGVTTDKEINERIKEIRTKKSSLLDSHLVKHTISDKQKLIKIATKKLKDYYKIYEVKDDE